MPDFRVDSVYNLTAIEEEQAKFLAFLAQSKSAILDLNNQRVVVKSSDVSTFTQASDNLNKSVASSNTALKNITSTSVEYNKQLALSAKASKDAAQAKLIEAKAILEQEKADAVRTKSLIAQEKELDRLIKLDEKRKAAAPNDVIDMGSRDQGNSSYLGLKGEAFSAEAKAAQEAEVSSTLESVSAHEKLKESLLTEDQVRQRNIEAQRKSVQALREFEAANSGAIKQTDELTKAKAAVAKANSAENVQLQGLNAQKALANKAAKEEALTNLGLIDAYTLLNKEYQAAAINAKNLAVQYGIDSVEAKAAAAEALALNTQIQAIDKTVGQSQKNVGNYANGVEKGISKVWGGLRKIAYIIPGLGIAGLISLIVGPLIEAFQLWFKSLDKLATQQRLISQINNDAVESFGKEAGELKVLRAEVESTLIPMNKRLQVVKDLKAEYPDYFAGLTNEQILTGNVADAYDRATESILRKAKAQAAQAQIEKNSAQELKIIQADQLDVEETNTRLRRQTGKSTVDEFGNLINVTKQTNTLLLDAFKKRQQARKDEQADIKKDNDFLLKYVLSGDNIELTKPKKEKKEKTDSLQELKDRLNTEFDIYKIAQEAKIRLFDKETKDENIYYLDKLTALDNYVSAEKELLDRQAQNEIENANAAAARETQHLQESKVGKSAPEKARIDQNILIVQKNLEQQILLIKAKYADLGNQVIEKAADTRQDIVEKHLKVEQDLYEQIAKDEQKNIDDDNARIKKGFEDRAKAEEEAAKKKIELLKELRQQEEQLAVEAGNFLYNLATSGYERQLNLITDQGKALQKRKDEELAANDAVVQSAQDKAANVILINARAQAQQDALDRKTADIKNKEAKFERSQQIFDIGISTIKTLAQIKLQAALLLANPLTAALAPIALAQIPLALATSALSIGAILAKPLPHYKYGRGEKGEEFAIVGDGGVNEFIARGNGTIEKTPAVNTLTHLMPKDKVYPSKEALMKELMLNSMQLSSYSVAKDGGINKNDIDKLGRRIENSISDIRIQTQLVTKSGWRNHNERLSKYDAWVERVIKN